MLGSRRIKRATLGDLRFIVETLMPWEVDQEQATHRLQADEGLLRRMLDDNRLFQRLLDDEKILLQVSSWLFFTVLLRRVWRDIGREAYTVEQRGRRKVTLFDNDQVVQLLEPEAIRDYLATMLASFTRIESVLVMVETERGAWRGYHTNELDVEGMIRYSQTLDQPFRFTPYKRIGDVCLFLAGIFPEHISNQYRYPVSRKRRPGMRGKLCQTIEDYEAHGKTFYQLAAEHQQAWTEELSEVLTTLAESFVLAKKSLSFLANRYLQFTRYNLFDL